MQQSIETTAQKIKQLEIQGARNVAIAAIESIVALAKQTRASTKDELMRELLDAKETLFATRETEPLMRNAVRYSISQIERSHETKAKTLAKLISSASHQFLRDLEATREHIAEIGVRRITSGSVVLTHCHSSTVTHLLQKAKLEGIGFEVICTETRPLFQGRITAKEMLESGIRTTMIVDSAARFFMNQVDIVIVGSDAITSEGNVINKIGTSMIALAAHEARTPFYVVSELLKFDPATMHGDFERIEQRSPSEIWTDPPKHLSLKNPAFDVTRRDFIHGIICEEGIISPHSTMEVVRRKYPWVFEQSSE